MNAIPKIILGLFVCANACAAEVAPDKPREFHEPLLEAAGLSILCLGVGLPTCSLFGDGPKTYSRPWTKWGLGISYLPSYVMGTSGVG